MRKGFKNTSSVTLRLFPGASSSESVFDIVKVSGNPQTIDLEMLLQQSGPVVDETKKEVETFDGYFPDDGYDYTQHLRDINPERFIEAKAKAAKPSDEVDYELAEVLAAMDIPDDTQGVEIDTEFVCKLGPLDERTRLGLMWGEDQVDDYLSMPTEKLIAIQTKLRELEERRQQSKDDDFNEFFAREFNEAKIGGLSSDLVEIDNAYSDADDCDELIMTEGSDDENVEDEDPEAIHQECIETTKRLISMNDSLQVSVLDLPDDETEILIVPASNVPDWDCESVLSTRSNIFNHPGLIRRQYQGPRRNKVPVVASISEADEEEHEVDTPVKTVSTLRKKDETTDERRERKKAIKEFQREQRAHKKAEHNERRVQLNADKRTIAVLKHNNYGDIPSGVPKFNL
jgi:protein LTV1